MGAQYASRILLFRKGSSQGAESAFQKTIFLSGLAVVVLLVAIFLSLLFHSFPSLDVFGFSFIYGKTWDPVARTFGALPFLVGTLLTSFLALLISLPFSLAVSIFIGEYFREGALSSFLRNVTDLLAGIPSIIYGFWALFVLVPVVRNLEISLGIFPYGVGIFTASLILSVMIIPYSASIGREVISLVPSDIKEAAYSLGATRQEVITKVILPYARSGIGAGVLLALGRALGETMAVTMVIGNSNLLPRSLFSPGNTMASVIANEFTEATGRLYLSSLIEVGLLLFLVTLIINVIGRYMIKKISVEA
ncbi:MAG: phosphate ABC transporter permease subunit PstC [Desulfobacteraceae bacterium]|jgi:phosphate transport system permease protein